MKKIISAFFVLFLIVCMCSCETTSVSRTNTAEQETEPFISIQETEVHISEGETSSANKLNFEGVSAEDIVFVCEDPTIATVQISTIITGRIYYKVLGLAEGETTIIAKSEDGSVVSEQQKVYVVKPTEPVELEGCDILLSNAEIEVGSTYVLRVEFNPEDATDKELTWYSSDENVATVNLHGTIKAVGVGKTTITAKTSNGLSDSCEVTVIKTYKPQLMYVSATCTRSDGINIGDSWSRLLTVNGEEIKLLEASEFMFTCGETIECYARWTEADERPDVGEITVRHEISESDLADGFTIEKDLYVRENGGPNIGKEAHFVVRFIFTPGN